MNVRSLLARRARHSIPSSVTRWHHDMHRTSKCEQPTLYHQQDCEISPYDECRNIVRWSPPFGRSQLAYGLGRLANRLSHKPAYRQPVNYIHHCHLLLLSLKADTHFTIPWPWRVEGWVDLGGQLVKYQKSHLANKSFVHLSQRQAFRKPCQTYGDWKTGRLNKTRQTAQNVYDSFTCSSRCYLSIYRYP